MKRYGQYIFTVVLFFAFLGCDAYPVETEEEKEKKRIQGYSGIINGTWNYVNSNGNRTGSIITISNGVGILTAIGSNDVFTVYSNRGQLYTGDAVIKSISYNGAWGSSGNTVYWTCEFNIPFSKNYNYAPDPEWRNTYISHNTRTDDGIFVFTSGNPGLGFGFSFRR